MGAFVISKRFDEYYKFVFTSRKGKAIFTSFRYELKFECEEDLPLTEMIIGDEYVKNYIEDEFYGKAQTSIPRQIKKYLSIKLTDEIFRPDVNAARSTGAIQA